MKIRDKKRLILNIAVIFLIVMLILTFFSNTIMNWSLVEVETSSINSGTVTTEIRDTVAVSTISDYQVTLPQSRKIATIQVSLGDKVKPGDLLFTLEGAGDEELEPAEKELEQLKLEYQTTLLSIKIPPYAVENAEIQTLQKALEQAVAERNALGNTSLTLTEAQSRMLNAQNEQSLQNEAVNKLQNELAQIDANDPALSSIRELVLAVQEANAALSQKQLLYDNTAAELGQNYNELLAYISELQQEIDGMEWDDPQRVEALERLGNLQDSLAVISPLYAELSTAKGALDKANNALEKKTIRKACHATTA